MSEPKSYLVGNGAEYYKGWDVARLCQKLSRGVWATGTALKHLARPSKPLEHQTAVQAYVLDLRKAANYLNHAADEIEAGRVAPLLEVADVVAGAAVTADLPVPREGYVYAEEGDVIEASFLARGRALGGKNFDWHPIRGDLVGATAKKPGERVCRSAIAADFVIKPNLSKAEGIAAGFGSLTNHKDNH